MFEQPPIQEGTVEPEVIEVAEPKKPIKVKPVEQPTKQIISQQGTAKNGRDEMNLAEHPIALLSHHRNPNQREINIQWREPDSQGRWITKSWIVRGANGLLTSESEKIMVGLMALTHESGFRTRTIKFKGADMIRLLGWTVKSGKSYQRLESALETLKGITITSRYTFWDNKEKRYLPWLVFGIVDRALRPNPEDKTYFVTWGEDMWGSFNANYIKALDTQLYFSLKSAISRRLFHFLDKHFYHKIRREFNLMDLATRHLGMSSNYNRAQVKRYLTPAIEELINYGYLKRYEYQPPKGRTKTVIFYKNTQQRAVAKPVEKPTETGDSQRLTFELVRYGIPETVARQLVESYHDRIEAQIKYHEYRLQLHADQVSKNPAGFLRKAIEENWTAPADYISPEEQQRRAEKEVERQRRQEHQFKVDRYKEWLGMTPEEKVKGDLWLWEHQYRKGHDGQLPTAGEKQAKEQELIRQLPTDEEKQIQIFGSPLEDTKDLFE